MDSTALGGFLKSLRLRIDRNAEALGPHRRLPARRGRLPSQEEIAEALEVSRGWYGLLESGANIRASTRLLARIAETLMLSDEERAELFRLAVPELYSSDHLAPKVNAAWTHAMHGTFSDRAPLALSGR
jgi:transcriptional regulator with XRE-family HTH domain